MSSDQKLTLNPEHTRSAQQNQPWPFLEGPSPSEPYTIISYRTVVGQIVEQPFDPSELSKESSQNQPYERAQNQPYELAQNQPYDRAHDQPYGQPYGQPYDQPYMSEYYSLNHSKAQDHLDEINKPNEKIPLARLITSVKEKSKPAMVKKTRPLSQRAVLMSALEDQSLGYQPSPGEALSSTIDQNSLTQYAIVNYPLENPNPEQSGQRPNPMLSVSRPKLKPQDQETLRAFAQDDSTLLVEPSKTVAGLTDRVRFSPFKAMAIFLLSIFTQLKATQAWALGLGGLGQNVATNLSGIAKAVQMFGFAAGLTL
ncbi:MAG: hypothetical protein LBE80_04350, partial [Deltaproteobacteria bacterium]|nr:hypothetical protein [Deltaproteobacteria bacterium]